MQERRNNVTSVCPTCRRTAIPRIKVHERDDGRIVVTEYCGFCRSQLAQRESTHEIERVRRDIRNLRRKVDGGETYLSSVLQDRVNTYNRLIRNL